MTITGNVKIDWDSIPDTAWDNLCRALNVSIKATLNDPVEGAKLRKRTEERMKKNEQ